MSDGPANILIIAPTDLEHRHFVCKVKFVMSGRISCWGGGFTLASTSVLLRVWLRAMFDPVLNEKRGLSLRFSSLEFEVAQLQSSYGTTCVCQQVVLWSRASRLGRCSSKRGVLSVVASCVMTFFARQSNRSRREPGRVAQKGRRRLSHIATVCWLLEDSVRDEHRP
jgi:hypothetical protein